MKVIKNINNNVSLCIDSKGREVVAFGKGIGFIRPPYEIPLEKIDRTFYSHNISDYSVLEEIPVNVIEVSIKIVEELEKSLNVTMLSSAALSIADHINFAIKRNVENVKMEMPIQEDLKLLYPKEWLLGEWTWPMADAGICIWIGLLCLGLYLGIFSVGKRVLYHTL